VNDSSAGYDLWFGGSVGSGSGAVGATWIDQGGNWTNVTAQQSFSPPARSFASAVYDAANRVVVLFGGLGAGNYLGDTWLWANSSWTNVTAYAGVGPGPRADASMAYDARDREVLLFGGEDSNGTLGDTWTFSTGQWARILPSPAPPPACCGTMAYDSTDQETVLEITSSLDSSTFTWTFALGNWTDRSISNAPKPRQWAVMVDDPAVGGTLLFGGTSLSTSPYDPLGDAWIFAGNVWSSTAAASNGSQAPPARWGAAAAPEVPEGSQGCFLLVGGWGIQGPAPLDGQVWQGCGNRSVWANGSGSGQGELPPVLSIVADHYSGNAPLLVNFSASVKNGTAPFNLSLCASNIGCQTVDGWSGAAPQNRVVLFNVSGTYGLTAFVIDADGLSASATASVIVAQPSPLEATVSETPEGGAAPLITKFSATVTGGTGPYTVQWDFGDGIVEPGAVYNYTYPNPGEFYPTVVITDNSGQRLEKTLPPVQVHPPSGGSVSSQTPWIVAYGLSVAIIILGVVGAVLVYRVRRGRVVSQAEATIREVEEPEEAPPPAEEGIP
jgi:PKD repeat protein